MFVSRLAGLRVFDPLGEKLGRVRDVVTVFRTMPRPPSVVGLLVEVGLHRTVFLPVRRITSMESGQVICTNISNQAFEQRQSEVLLISELLDQPAHLVDGSGQVTIEDLAISSDAHNNWTVTQVFISQPQPRSFWGWKRSVTRLVDWTELILDVGAQNTHSDQVVASFSELKPADIAVSLSAIPEDQRMEIAARLPDERLADVVQELSIDNQVLILQALDQDRAAEIIEIMEPDDAADLLREFSPSKANSYLQLLEEDKAAQLRKLMSYDEYTAGGLMTTEAVILPPDATIAEALAYVRRSELSPAIAAAVFICDPPLEPTTGKFHGVVHIQRMLRYAPPELLGDLVDRDIAQISPSASINEVTRLMATYNLVSIPILDRSKHLLGVVTVDDVLDHLLPEDWRDTDSTPIIQPAQTTPLEDGGTHGSK